MFKCFVLNHPGARQPDGVVVRTSERVLHVMSDESNIKALLLADTLAGTGMSSSKVTRSLNYSDPYKKVIFYLYIESLEGIFCRQIRNFLKMVKLHH